MCSEGLAGKIRNTECYQAQSVHIESAQLDCFPLDTLGFSLFFYSVTILGLQLSGLCCSHSALLLFYAAFTDITNSVCGCVLWFVSGYTPKASCGHMGSGFSEVAEYSL